MTKLQMLALDRIREFGEIALKAHAELEKWRESPLETVDRMKLSLNLTQALEIQRDWIDAIEEDAEE